MTMTAGLALLKKKENPTTLLKNVGALLSNTKNFKGAKLQMLHHLNRTQEQGWLNQAHACMMTL